MPGNDSTEARWAVVEAAYHQLAPAIAERLLALTGEPGVVEDLVNETFVRAYERLPHFEARSALSTWLHGIAINLARGHVAKRRRRRRIDAELTPPQPTVAAANQETEVRQRQAAQRLYTVLASLPDQLREAFVLCVVEQRPLREVSEQTGVPISTLHARRQRAEVAVRAAIDKESSR